MTSYAPAVSLVNILYSSKTYSKYIPETAATPGRETGRSKSGPNQGVGDEQATGVGAAEPAAARAERSL